MSTTILIIEETRELLRKLKEEGAAMCQELIRDFMKYSKSLKSSQRGKYPQLRSFKTEKIDRF